MGDHRDGRTFIERRIRILTPLHHRDFRMLWTGMTASLLGDGIFPLIARDFAPLAETWT